MLRAFVICLCLAIASVVHAADPSAPTLRRENSVLDAELGLASKPLVYFHIDLASGRVVYKSRGVAIRQVKFDTSRTWGRPENEGVCNLIKSKATRKPKRESIAPGEANLPLPPEIKALEVTDMPDSYTMHFDNGLVLSVEPSDLGALGLVKSVAWYATRPLYTLWYAAQGKRYISVQAFIEPSEARALYWSMIEGAKCLVTWR